MATMYDTAMVSAGAASLATLPLMGISVAWLVLAAFTLLMAGGALLRAQPRNTGKQIRL
jgi:hypothetical protein